MLVLTRRVGEKIMIGGDICITVLARKGDRIRIGVSAPESVRVDREEVHRQRAEFVPKPERLDTGAMFASMARSLGHGCLHNRKLLAFASTRLVPGPGNSAVWPVEIADKSTSTETVGR